MENTESRRAAQEAAEREAMDVFMEKRFAVRDEQVPVWARDVVLTIGEERSRAAQGNDRDDEAYRAFKQRDGSVEPNNIGLLLKEETRIQLQDLLDKLAQAPLEATDDARDDAEMEAGFGAYSSTLYYLLKNGHLRNAVESIGRERIETYMAGTEAGRQVEQDLFIALYDLGLDAERMDT